MTDPEKNSQDHSVEALFTGLEIPTDLKREFSAVDNLGWNDLVTDLKERQANLHGLSENGTIGWDELKEFQERLDRLDPSVRTGEREAGRVDIVFEGFIVHRIDNHGRESIEHKSPIVKAADESVRSAECRIELISFSPPSGDHLEILALHIEDVFSNDKIWLAEYFQDPTAEIYVPVANLVHRR